MSGRGTTWPGRCGRTVPTPGVPVVRKTRRAPVRRRAAAAASRSGTTVHRSPGSGTDSGLSTRRRGTSADRQATTAWWGMWAVNGWVASMTAAMWLSAIQRANPGGPPNPPTRTSPAGMDRAFTLPANEEVTATLGQAARRAASSDASLDPASSKILGTSRGSGRRGHSPSVGGPNGAATVAVQHHGEHRWKVRGCPATVIGSELP